METKTIIETTTQVTTDNAIFEITTSKVNGVVDTITANVTAQIWQKDDRGGHTLSAELGTITKSEKGIKIDGTIPSYLLTTIIDEFLKITEEQNGMV